MGYKQMVNNTFSLILILASVIASSQVVASTLTIPNSFTSGSTTSAAEMNANFSAVKSAIDDNFTRLSALDSSVSSFKGFSSGTSNGGSGFITLGNLCDATFTGSHVCSTREFVSLNYSGATGLVGNAWIMPERLAVVGETADNVTGVSTHNMCDGWTGTTVNDKTIVVSSVGSFTMAQCSSVNAVACCI